MKRSLARKTKTNKAYRCNKITRANKFNSIMNQLKLTYYATKDSTINIKVTEFKGKQIHNLTFDRQQLNR